MVSARCTQALLTPVTQTSAAGQKQQAASLWLMRLRDDEQRKRSLSGEPLELESFLKQNNAAITVGER